MKRVLLALLLVSLIATVMVIPATAEESIVSEGATYTRTGVYFDADKGFGAYNKEGVLTDGITVPTGTEDNLWGYPDPGMWAGLHISGTAETGIPTVGVNTNEIIIDLGEYHSDMNKIVVYAQYGASGISEPTSIKAAWSDDDFVYSDDVEFVDNFEKIDEGMADSNGTDVMYSLGTYTLNTAFEGRYVKLTVVNSTAWVFLSEVEIYAGGEVAEVSEPEETSEEASSEESVEDESSEAPAESSEAKEESSKASESTSSKTSSTTTSSKASSDTSGSDSKGLETWVIVVIAAAAIVVIAVVVIVIVKKRKKD